MNATPLLKLISPQRLALLLKVNIQANGDSYSTHRCPHQADCSQAA